jgi:hypothetical protein
MTDFAFSAITSVMDVVQGVACITVLRGLVVLCIQMATVAGNLLMVSEQRKFCGLMIKIEILPLLAGMAIAT